MNVEMKNVLQDINIRLWDSVKKDDQEEQLVDIENIYNNTYNIIKEAIQVCAMCERYKKDLGKEN